MSERAWETGREKRPIGETAPEEEGRDVFEAREGSADDPPSAATWHPYDFRQKAHHLARGQVRKLELGLREVAQLASRELSRSLRHDVPARASRVEVLDWSEALERLPPDITLYPVDCPALRTSCFLDVSPGLLIAFVERALGGRPPRAGTPLPRRALTALEERLAVPILRRLVFALDHGFCDGGSVLGLELIDPDTTPAEPRSRFRDGPAVVLSFGLSLGSASGRVEIIVPHGPLLPYLCGPAPKEDDASSPHGSAATDEETEAALRERIAPVPVDVAVDLTTEPLPLPALLTLRPGDIIDTGLSVETPVDVRVSGRAVARGQIGTEGDRLAIRIVSIGSDSTNESESPPSDAP
ncbi:MAG TPA: FliM/FliN family flagellar motor switch protein [Planctomycetota bacterium]|nr:FliM/FliN family flagellar motor switch protein [Planctomycetota bacterium]